MLERKLKAAVVGLGVGNQHALTLLEHPDAELLAVVEHDAERARSFNAEHGVDTATFDDVLSSDIDIVSLASFDEDHYAQVMSGLDNDKHIFVEKPLCQTRAELEDIYRLWNSKDCMLASNLVLRQADLYVWLKAYIQSGAMGEIYAFDGDYLYGRLHKITEGWRSETENYSVMEGGGIHIIDLMLMLTGQKPAEVQSYANKIASKGTNFRYHDFQSSHFMFESGLIGRITANFGCIHRHHHALRIFGSKQTFIYDDAGPRLHETCDEDAHAKPINQNPLPVGKGVLIPGFIENILKGDIKDQTQREFDLMSVVLSADEAREQGTAVKIEYLT